MNKIKKYIITFAILLIGLFIVDNTFVFAEDSVEGEINNKLDTADEFVVINPNSEGEANYKYFNVQYTRARDITLKVLISKDTLTEYDSKFDVCEYMSEFNMNDKCAFYMLDDEEVNFQLSSINDGKKTLTIYFYKKGEYGNKNGITKEVVKEIVLDTTGPIITITGGEYIYLPAGSSYKEQGAICVDYSDIVFEDCQVTVETANIDMNKEGYQYVRYTATDFLGNEVNAVKKVLVEIKVNESNNKTSLWIGLGIGVAIIAAFLLLHAWKNKEKQKNQSVLS